MLKRRRFLVVGQAVLMLAGLAFLWPRSLGGAASYVIVSGRSMEPTLRDGDLSLLRERKSYTAGDVVAFRVPKGEPGEGAVVIHRIVGEAQGAFVVQGDNKASPDPWEPGPQEILGRAWLVASGGGRVLSFFRQPVILGSMAGVLGMLFVLADGKKPGQRPWVVHDPGGIAVVLHGARSRGSPPRTEPVVSITRPKAQSFGSNTRRKVERQVNQNGVRPASRRDFWKAMQKDGRRRLRKELPPNAQVNLVLEGSVTRWQVTAEDRFSERESLGC